MATNPSLIWQIFQAIEKNESGDYFWNLLEHSKSSDGLVYMTYASQTPETLTEQFRRHQLHKLIKVHQQLTYLRCRMIE